MIMIKIKLSRTKSEICEKSKHKNLEDLLATLKPHFSTTLRENNIASNSSIKEFAGWLEYGDCYLKGQ